MLYSFIKNQAFMNYENMPDNRWGDSGKVISKGVGFFFIATLSNT
jgi:hypothetical protein